MNVCIYALCFIYSFQYFYSFHAYSICPCQLIPSRRPTTILSLDIHPPLKALTLLKSGLLCLLLMLKKCHRSDRPDMGSEGATFFFGYYIDFWRRTFWKPYFDRPQQHHSTPTGTKPQCANRKRRNAGIDGISLKEEQEELYTTEMAAVSYNGLIVVWASAKWDSCHARSSDAHFITTPPRLLRSRTNEPNPRPLPHQSNSRKRSTSLRHIT